MSDATFGRLFILMVVAMTVLTVLIVVIAIFASADVNEKIDARAEIENSQAIADRLAPVGEFAAGEPVAEVTAEPVILSGEEAYASCGTCHDAGIAGAPAIGAASAWENRIAKGIETLYSNAINGYQGEAGYMPAKGGNASLSDESVKAAVDYIIERVQ